MLKLTENTKIDQIQSGYVVTKKVYEFEITMYLNKELASYQTGLDERCIYSTIKEALQSRCKILPISSHEFETALEYWDGSKLVKV